MGRILKYVTDMVLGSMMMILPVCFCKILFLWCYFIIECTLPIFPSVRRTLIPWGCVELLVSMFLTVPSVSFPLLWCCFKTIFTRVPTLIWLLCWLDCISSHTCFVAYSMFSWHSIFVKELLKIMSFRQLYILVERDFDQMSSQK